MNMLKVLSGGIVFPCAGRAAVEALMKKEKQDETQFTTKIDGFLSFTPPFNVLFCRFF